MLLCNHKEHSHGDVDESVIPNNVIWFGYTSEMRAHGAIEVL